MKKAICFVCVIIIMLNACIFAKAEAELAIEAPSAILIEKTSGKVIYEKDADQKMRPASVTKIMTLLLIMEAIESGVYGYNDIVTASAYATSMGGSQVYLKEGEKFTVDDMIKCIAVASANDCCVAMAEFTSGSAEAFVAKMNSRAKELGMENTEFKNCTGLDADGHLTTARDISIMSQQLLKHDDIKKYTGIWTDSIRDGSFGLTNTNKLIRFYDSATGLKTGYTSASGYCISATAEQNGMELIAVVMAAKTSDSRNSDAKAMLNYGFSKYEIFTPDLPKLDTVKVIKGKQDEIVPITNGVVSAIVEKGKKDDAKYEVTLCRDVEAPVEKGQKLGEVKITLDGKEIAKTDIVCNKSIKRAGVFDIFLKILYYFLMV